MRVAVVGATGNAGTAVLKALKDTPEVTSVLGIARRMPDTSAEPFTGCEWASIDIAAASSDAAAAADLTKAFTEVDAVIHLAWLIQPNSERDLLRRVNVEGTARVARAAVAAGVEHLVVASSVGAYSPDQSQAIRDERWPAGGISTSHYSVDKAAQEQVLDEFSAAHPDVTVTRLRPALIFRSEAASEIQRYFLGSWVPVQALRAGKPPALPIPKGLRGVQAVHADDLGRAYAAAVVTRKSGAFNICADDILGPQELADIVDHGRFIELPPRLMRTALATGHKAKLVAADEGWLDMGMAVPMMDNARAKAELDWRPRFSAAEALESLLHGMTYGDGAESVPMRPRDPDRADLPAARGPVASGAAAGDQPSGGELPDRAGISKEISQDLLNLYLSDHLTGATAGAERIERMADAFIDTPVYAQLSELAMEIRLEHTFLQNLIHDLDMKQLPYRQAVSWIGERLGRLKNNGALTTRSPMTLVLETELMRSAVMGKIGVWQTLEDNAEHLNLDPEVFAELAKGTERQAAKLDEVHEYARARAFRDDRETFEPNTAGSAGNAAQSARQEEQIEERKMMTEQPENTAGGTSEEDVQTVPEAAPNDSAERPGSDADSHEHDDALADEWGEESFPGSDPPAHY